MQFVSHPSVCLPSVVYITRIGVSNNIVNTLFFFSHGYPVLQCCEESEYSSAVLSISPSILIPPIPSQSISIQKIPCTVCSNMASAEMIDNEGGCGVS